MSEAQQPSPAGQPQGGVVPSSVGGAFYNTGLVITLMIITLGIWGIFWTYRTNEDLKVYNRDGLGGVLGVVLYIILGVVLNYMRPDLMQPMLDHIFGYILVFAIMLMEIMGVLLIRRITNIDI